MPKRKTRKTVVLWGKWWPTGRCLAWDGETDAILVYRTRREARARCEDGEAPIKVTATYEVPNAD